MPLWKVYTQVGAYSDADKAEFVAKITEAYGTVPIPAFYVVVIFEEVAANNIFVGGKPHSKIVQVQNRPDGPNGERRCGEKLVGSHHRYFYRALGQGPRIRLGGHCG